MPAPMPRRRALLLVQCFPPRLGGIEAWMGALAETLSRQGVEVTVLADAARGGARHDAGAAYSVRRFGGPRPLRRRLKGLAARWAARSADVVYADSWKSLEHAWLGGAPRVVCHAHGNELPEAPTDRRARRVRAALAKATTVLAASRLALERLEALAPPGVALALRTPPIAAPAPADDDEKALACAAWPLAGGPRLLCVARLEPLKGVDRVIAALPELSARHPEVSLVVAGDGPDRARLEDLVRTTNCEDRVRFVGFVQGARKAALYAAADLFTMPTRAVGRRRESFGMVYLEAALAGTPALAGDAGGSADAVAHERTGMLCDGESQEEVTAALGALLADRARLTRLGSAAREHAEGQLWPARISDYLGDFPAACAPGPRPAR